MRRIKITDGNIIIHGTINGTVAAKDFEKRLPCMVNAVAAENGYLATVPKGIYNPMELTDIFEKGDVGLFGGYFYLYDKSGNGNGCFQKIMIIGKIDENEIYLLEQLGDKVKLKVTVL